MTNIVYNMDCMKGMRGFPDKFFDLAIVDPPYNIENKIARCGGSHTKTSVTFGYIYAESGKNWDKKVSKKYFKELFRVSKNQIICGGNYFDLPICRGFIVWDKIQTVDNFSHAEFIWTSLDMPAKIFRYNHKGGTIKDKSIKIHPTQKPVALYDYLIKVAKLNPESNILDTHIGSGSIRIACHKAGMNLTGFEIDKDYFDAQEERYQIYKNQLNLFENVI